MTLYYLEAPTIIQSLDSVIYDFGDLVVYKGTEDQPLYTTRKDHIHFVKANIVRRFKKRYNPLYYKRAFELMDANTRIDFRAELSLNPNCKERLWHKLDTMGLMLPWKVREIQVPDPLIRLTPTNEKEERRIVV